jgi:hypothetical protein
MYHNKYWPDILARLEKEKNQMADIDKAVIPEEAKGHVLVEKEQPRGFINALLVRRKDERGDLVGTLAMWAFVAMLFCLVFGGSSFEHWGLVLKVPAISLESLVGLLSPIIAHCIKSTVEGVKQP